MTAKEKKQLIAHVCDFVEEHKEDGEHCSFCLGYNEGLYDLQIAVEHFLSNQYYSVKYDFWRMIREANK